MRKHFMSGFIWMKIKFYMICFFIKFCIAEIFRVILKSRIYVRNCIIPIGCVFRNYFIQENCASVNFFANHSERGTFKGFIRIILCCNDDFRVFIFFSDISKNTIFTKHIVFISCKRLPERFCFRKGIQYDHCICEKQRSCHRGIRMDSAESFNHVPARVRSSVCTIMYLGNSLVKNIHQIVASTSNRNQFYIFYQ